MAQLKTLICKGCGSPIGLDQLERCPYCKKQNFIMGSIDPLTMEGEKVQEMIAFYKNKIESNAKDTNSLFALGLFYLGLKNYRFAQQNFLKAVEQSPMEPDVYYYFALSLMAGRTSKNLDHDEAIEIEEQIHTAVRMERKRKYLTLLACIEQGAFISNGLQAKDNPETLIQEALKIIPEAGELEEIEMHAPPADKESRKYMSMLQTGNKKQTEVYDSDDEDIGGINEENMEYPDVRDFETSENGYDELVASEQNRTKFFEYLWQPVTPNYKAKPFYPIWYIIKSGIVCIILFFVFAIICTMLRMDKGAEAKREFVAITENTPDSVLVQDSLFIAEHWFLGYKLPNKNGEYKSANIGLPSDSIPRPYMMEGYIYNFKAYRYVGIIFSPIAIWIIILIVSCCRCYCRRKQIKRENNELKERYNEGIRQYESRPTIQDYLIFCRDYLGQDKISYGDVVTQILNNYDIAERNIAGKILFVNFFDTYDENGNAYNMPEQILDRIYYTVAIPQKDQLFIVQNFWDTVNNKQTKPQIRTVFYGNIAEVLINPETEQLEIHTNRDGVIAIELPPYGRSNILHYQSNNVQSIQDYSITRTGNVHEFFNALSTLVRTYQK